MNNHAYNDYLQSGHWRRLKARAFQRYGKSCQCCGSHKNIEGHHLIYREDLRDGQIDDVMPLCQICHEIVHATPAIFDVYNTMPSVAERRSFIIRCFRRVAAPDPIVRVQRPHHRHPRAESHYKAPKKSKEFFREKFLRKASNLLGKPIEELRPLERAAIRLMLYDY